MHLKSDEQRQAAIVNYSSQVHQGGELSIAAFHFAEQNLSRRVGFVEIIFHFKMSFTLMHHL